MKYRNLELVRTIIKDATDLDISYAYDDLVFPDNVVFLIKYDDANDQNFFGYFRKDCQEKEKESIVNSLTKSCEIKSCTFEYSGVFDLKQKGEEISINFL